MLKLTEFLLHTAKMTDNEDVKEAITSYLLARPSDEESAIVESYIFERIADWESTEKIDEAQDLFLVGADQRRLAAVLNDDMWAPMLTQTQNGDSESLHDLSVDSNVGACCLHLIIQVDRLLDCMPDLSPAARARFRDDVIDQCETWYYG